MPSPPRHLPSLVALAREAREGGDEALEALLRESAGMVHAIARARLGDGIAAEDATAAALERVARGLPRLRKPEAFGPWLGRIARRCAADAARRSRTTADPSDVEATDPATDPVDALLQAERRAAVREAIAALPVRGREVVLLHFVEGLTYREIAGLLRMGLGTVARRMKRALEALRGALGVEP